MKRRVRYTTTVPLTPEKATDLLERHSLAFRPSTTPSLRRHSRFVTELRVETAEGMSVTHLVAITPGTATRASDSFTLPLHIEAADHGTLFPTFDGAITIRSAHRVDAEVTMAGTYRPPFGFVGRIGDRLFGRGRADDSLRHLFDNLIERLRREDEAPSKPTPTPAADDLRGKDSPLL